MSDAPPAAAKSGGSKKMIVIALVALLAAGGGGGAAWFFLGKKHGEGEEEHVEVKKKHAAKPLFTTLEPFTVNLADPRGERFAQIGITLQFEDPKVEMELKDRLPAVRNEILMLISSKQIDELLTTEGKQKLADEIRARSARAMGIEVAEDDEDEAEAKPAKAAKAAKDDGHAKDEDDEAPKPKKKAKKKARGEPNPIQGVLFSQFIVQ